MITYLLGGINLSAKKITTEEYKIRVFNRYGGSIEIIGEYVSVLHPIEIISHCELHGSSNRTLITKNILSKSFTVCKKCSFLRQSVTSSGTSKTDKELYYLRLKEYCEFRGGVLISKTYVNANKEKYEVACGNPNHPNFFNIASKLSRTGNQWCPYCSGRSGNFQEEISDIITSKGGIILGEYSKSSKHVEVKCIKHDYIWNVSPMNLKKGSWCPVCYLPYSEKVVYDYLINKGFVIIPQFQFEDLIGKGRLLRFDFGISKNGEFLGLIEIDDNTHRFSYKQKVRLDARNRDKKKDEYCKVNNIPLFRMTYEYEQKIFENYDWYYNYIHIELNDFLINLKVNYKDLIPEREVI